MTVQELIDKQIFGVVNLGDSPDRQITVPFCCDLLSIAWDAPRQAARG